MKEALAKTEGAPVGGGVKIRGKDEGSNDEKKKC